MITVSQPQAGVVAPHRSKGGAAPTYLVPYIIGDGTDPVLLSVIYIAEFPIGPDNACAFCHGDPCAETSTPETLIGAYWLRNPRAETCPLCDGRSS